MCKCFMKILHFIRERNKKSSLNKTPVRDDAVDDFLCCREVIGHTPNSNNKVVFTFSFNNPHKIY